MDVSYDRYNHTHSDNILIVYDCKDGKFQYPNSSKKECVLETRPLWQLLREYNCISADKAIEIENRIKQIAQAEIPQMYFGEYLLRDGNGERRWYRIGFICPIPQEILSITITDIDEEVKAKQRLLQMTEYDDVTGLLKRNSFCRAVQSILWESEAEAIQGYFSMIYFDIIRFKAINDIFGMLEGDLVLKYIAEVLRTLMKPGDVACRLDADRFVFFTNTGQAEVEKLVESLLDGIAQYDLPFEIACNVGIYVTCNEKIPCDSMLDRAILAQSTIKGSYSLKYKIYTEDMRDAMLTEQEIVGGMVTGLKEEQFVVYYQPQYNHSNGSLVGTEALVRWIHPEKGMISPGVFIPIFEKNGFITKLDLYVFEKVCIFLRRILDKQSHTVPISTNFSRHDIFQTDFIESLERIRDKYDIPAKYLRVEITESAIVGSSRQANDIIKRLHDCGYIVEMDDFGSGYSSLNVLKDIELDIIKLDMLFLAEETESNRGGTILSSIVRMAKWLDMPVIAEGVESVEQADFLRSIGCNYIQGYLYSKPLPEEKYEELLDNSRVGAKVPEMALLDVLNANNFWNPKSQETLIFSNYVGGAAIFDYHSGQVEVLRVNKKYLKEFDYAVTEQDLIAYDPMRFFDNKNKEIYYTMLDHAILTGEEQECETWRRVSSEENTLEAEWICIRTCVQMIGRSGDNYLFYAMVRNVTEEKRSEMPKKANAY